MVQETNDQPTVKQPSTTDRIGEGVKFERQKRACCRIVGSPLSFPQALRAEVLDRVNHTLA